MTTVMRNSLLSQEKEPKVKKRSVRFFFKRYPQEKIDQALEKCWQEEDSTEAIRALIRKKVDLSQASEQEIQRLYAFFGRKGIPF